MGFIFTRAQSNFKVFRESVIYIDHNYVKIEIMC